MQFVPLNAAFASLSSAQLRELKTPNGCLHHATNGDLISTVLKSSQDIESMAGNMLHITRNRSSGAIHVDKAAVTTVDLIAKNGVQPQILVHLDVI